MEFPVYCQTHEVYLHSLQDVADHAHIAGMDSCRVVDCLTVDQLEAQTQSWRRIPLQQRIEMICGLSP